MTLDETAGISSRREMIRFFDGYSVERKNELDERRSTKALVKSHLLEVLGATEAGLPEVFAPAGLGLKRIDDALFQARQPSGEILGFLEPLSPRVVALYSVLKSEKLDPQVRSIVARSPSLDHVWLSGLTFSVLWEIVAKVSSPNRYARLVFTHESIFDVDHELVDPAIEHEQEAEDSEEPEAPTEEGIAIPEREAQADEGMPIRERRAARFGLVDRVRVVQEKLSALQHTYAPLLAISQLRFPSPVGRGGHDFYENGKVTNRSDSFRDHRTHLDFVTRIYERMLGRTEAEAWGAAHQRVGQAGTPLPGAPLIVRFEEPLRQEVFEQWIRSTFERPRNRFRLWSNPIRLGPRKVHVYGLDRHLWQPLFLELTAAGCTAVIPRGTCGNTIHRLVTNIQRYLDPAATAFLGEVPYRQVVEDASRGVQINHGLAD